MASQSPPGGERMAGPLHLRRVRTTTEGDTWLLIGLADSETVPLGPFGFRCRTSMPGRDGVPIVVRGARVMADFGGEITISVQSNSGGLARSTSGTLTWRSLMEQCDEDGWLATHSLSPRPPARRMTP